VLPRSCPLVIDARFRLHALAWTLVAFVGYGMVSAIIPNPVFGRQIPPEAFAVAIWLLSAPLIGIVGATYTAPMPATAAQPLQFAPVGRLQTIARVAPVGLLQPIVGLHPVRPVEERRSTTLGTIGGLGAFLAIGCPVCNKIALVLLGWSGALSIWAPLQPVLGAASLVLLAVTAAWRIRIRMRGGACPT
jgi:branched-subunit amino acid transport protein